MKIQDLSPAAGSRSKRKRVGRGPGSGHGKTACRGHKGQKSRSGGKVRPGFEGGQMPLQRRLPKRGFTNIFKKNYALVNLQDLDRFDSDTVLDIQAFKDAGLIRRRSNLVKLLGEGDVSRPLVVQVHKASKTAIEKIAAAGGKVEIMKESIRTKASETKDNG